MEDKWGWIVAALVALLGAAGTLWAKVLQTKTEREKSVIDQFRQLMDDQRKENQLLRDRLALHDTHMDTQQILIEDLYARSTRCCGELTTLWRRIIEAGVDMGPMPESLKSPNPPPDFKVATAAQNTILLRDMDHLSASIPKATPPPKSRQM